MILISKQIQLDFPVVCMLPSSTWEQDPLLRLLVGFIRLDLPQLPPMSWDITCRVVANHLSLK